MYKVFTALFCLIVFLNYSHLLYHKLFSIRKTPFFFLLPFVGLLNLQLNKTKIVHLLTVFHPLEISHKLPCGCAQPLCCHSYLIFLFSLLAPVVVSSSTILAPPFPSSTQFLYCSSHLPSQRLRSSSHECFFSLFSKYSEGSYLFTVQKYMFH